MASFELPVPDEVVELRQTVPFNEVLFGFNELILYPVAQWPEKQIGYSIDQDGHRLDSLQAEWRPEWLIIGRENLVEEPFFVDLSQPGFPVYIAAHEEEDWRTEHECIADTLAGFLELLSKIKELSQGREFVQELAENPLDPAQKEQLLQDFGLHNPRANLDYWDTFLFIDLEAAANEVDKENPMLLDPKDLPKN